MKKDEGLDTGIYHECQINCQLSQIQIWRSRNSTSRDESQNMPSLVSDFHYISVLFYRARRSSLATCSHHWEGSLPVPWSMQGIEEQLVMQEAGAEATKHEITITNL